jgi:dCMP deaminase
VAERPGVDQYFMDMTHLVKARGTCPRRQVGAVIVKDKRVLTTGYNGAPRNFPHPVDVGCLRDELNVPRGMAADICPCLHAEQNAIIQAATTGVSIEGGELYCTTQPCTQCSRLLANCGITKVVFEESYPDPLAVGILTTAGVTLWKWDAQAKAATKLKGNTFEEAQDELRKKWREAPPSLSPKLPMAGDAPFEPTPRPATKGERANGEAAWTVRDLSEVPDRADVIRKLAQEKAEKKRREREGA